MSARRKAGDYPNLRPADIVAGGTLTLWRNPAHVPFKETDVWEISSNWDLLDDIPEAYARLEREEQGLAVKHDFAWDTDFGYLSPIPEHCGTALCVEGEFHLEALNLVGDLPAVLNAFEAIRFCSSSVVEDGIRQAAHIFHVRNDATLGISEHDLLKRARRLFSDLITQEDNARRSLVEDTPRILEDSVARALAVLRSARLLSPGELLDLLSPIRLAVSMGFLDGITRAETLKMMRDQLNAPVLPPARTAEDDRTRDARDAKLADRINARFANVRFSSLAKDYLT
ncbi:MAG: hypothetical protein ACI4RA_03265 [Kiritimatiellia bacterium]